MTDLERALAKALDELYWHVKAINGAPPGADHPETFDPATGTDVLGRARATLAEAVPGWPASLAAARANTRHDDTRQRRGLRPPSKARMPGQQGNDVMLTNEQVAEAIARVLKTFPTQYGADELELLISNTLNDMDLSYDPPMTICRPDDAPAHNSRMAAVTLPGPTGDMLRVCS